ncbi:MAG: hypothetical protein K6E85_09070 [Lachnospiraceae bacterium]|nr:hypothetical protein [Lachnospiraceae bacterium]
MRSVFFKALFICAVLLILSLPTAARGGESSASGLTSGSGESAGSGAALVSYGYDPFYDTVWFTTSKPDTPVWIADVKKDAGASLKDKDFIECRTTAEYDEDRGGYIAYISLCDKKAGLNIPSSKAAYIHVTIQEPADTKTEYEPNLIIDPSPCKKISVVLDYAAAGEGSERCAVKSLTVTDAGGSTVEYSAAMNKKEFDEQLLNILFGVYDEDKYLDIDSTVREEDDTTLGLTDIPRGVSVAAKAKAFPGKFVYTAIEGKGYDWIYHSLELDDWKDKRICNYRVEYDDADIKIGIQSGTGKTRLYEAGGTSGAGQNGGSDPEQTDHLFGKCIAVVYDTTDVSRRVLDHDASFIYYEKNADGNSEEGFYLVTMIDQNNVQRTSLKISDYGLKVTGSSSSAQFLTGDTIDIRVTAPTTAADFGLIVKESPDVILVPGTTSFMLNEVTAYYFNGSYLYEVIMENSDPDAEFQYKLGFRYLGSAATSSKRAYRTSKDVAVSVKKAPKQVKIKTDISKETVNLKNGLDFMVITNKEADYCSGIWYTILPYNKSGSSPNAVIPTEMFNPGKKAKESAEMYTNEKVSLVAIDQLSGDTDFTLLVRKSASYSKAAGMTDGEKGTTCELKILARTVAPVINKDYNTGYLAVADEKDSFTIPKIAAAVSDKTRIDAFEYAVISKEDYQKNVAVLGSLDMTSIKWAKFIPGKKITVGKTKTKYKMTDDYKVSDHTLSDGDYILIRRKGKTEKDDPYSPILASRCLVTTVGKKTAFSKEVLAWYLVE